MDDESKQKLIGAVIKKVDGNRIMARTILGEEIEIVSEKFTDYEIKTETEIHFSEHETHLAFYSDWQAEAFQDWLESKGMNAFAEWLKANKENY